MPEYQINSEPLSYVVIDDTVPQIGEAVYEQTQAIPTTRRRNRTPQEISSVYERMLQRALGRLCCSMERLNALPVNGFEANTQGEDCGIDTSLRLSTNVERSTEPQKVRPRHVKNGFGKWFEKVKSNSSYH